MCNNCCHCYNRCCEQCQLRGLNGAYNIIFWIFSLIIMALSFLIFVFALSIKYDSEVSSAISYELIENFKTGYFLDFYKCNTNENRIKFGTWQGTVKGCGKIENGVANTKILNEKKGKCDKDEVFLDNIPPQDIFFFKGIIICGKMKGNYYELLFSDAVVEKNENCPEGMKNCGYIDTIKNKLCLNNTLECPISYIKIKDINSSAPEDVTHLEEIKSEKIRFFYSSNPYSNSSEIPFILSAFKIADLKICALPNLYHSNFDLYNLEAIKKEYSENCVLKDYSEKVIFDTIRYHELNTINHYELYEENGIINKIKNFNLTNYGFNLDKYKDNNLKLYARTHFGFNKTCLKQRKTKFDLKELTEINSTGDKMKAWSKVIAAVFGFSTVCEILDFFIFSGDLSIIMVFKYLFTNAGVLISIGYTLIWGVYFDDSYEDNMVCSDFVTNYNYNIMINKIRRNGNFIFISSILICIIFTFNIGLIIVRCTEKGGCCDNCCKDCCCLCCVKICSNKDKENSKNSKKEQEIDNKTASNNSKDNIIEKV